MTTTQTADVTLRDPLPVPGTRLVVLMYDGFIGALHKALDAIESGDAEARCRAILMATDILAQLCDSLDMEKGGQIAENLDKLTRDLKLDYFVLFSTLVTLIGNAGQGNYVAANAFMEGLARRRRQAAG